MPQGMDSLFGLIGEAVWNKLSHKKDKNAGYTPNQMFTNQGPMGTPVQDPKQYDFPYRAPYGPDMPIHESDIRRPLGNTMSRGSEPGKWSQPDPLFSREDQMWMNAPVAADSINARMSSSGYPNRVTPYGMEPYSDLYTFMSADKFLSPDSSREALFAAAKQAAEQQLARQQFYDMGNGPARDLTAPELRSPSMYGKYISDLQAPGGRR